MSSQVALATEDPTESTPLLRTLSSIAEPSIQEPPLLISRPASPTDVDDADTPLPKAQIFFICVARAVEPIAFFGIFPFISEMIWETGQMEKGDVGFYSGLIESMFSFTQMCLMILWGRAADRVGRKPVLVFSLGGISIATAVFGLSRTVWQMIFFRCCAGVFAGTVVTLRTMISENSTPKTQARTFSFFAFSGNLGIFIGPLIGGSLSNPTKQYPINKIFGGVEFFKDYPYALPTFVAGFIAVIATLLSALFIKETLIRKEKGGAAPTPRMTTWEVTKAPGVPMTLFVYACIMLLGIAYTAVMPLFYFTPAHLGGYNLTPPQISFFIAVSGVSQAIWLLAVFPPLQLRYGTVGVLRGCLMAWPFLFACGPLCNMLLKNGLPKAFWIIAPLVQAIGSGVAMAFTCVQLLLNSRSPSPPSSAPNLTSNLGTLNAIALTILSGTRSIGPWQFTSIFAASVRYQILGGYLVWAILILLSSGMYFIVKWGVDDVEGEGTKKGKGKGKGKGKDEDVVVVVAAAVGEHRREALRNDEEQQIVDDWSSSEETALTPKGKRGTGIF